MIRMSEHPEMGTTGGWQGGHISSRAHRSRYCKCYTPHDVGSELGEGFKVTPGFATRKFAHDLSVHLWRPRGTIFSSHDTQEPSTKPQKYVELTGPERFVFPAFHTFRRMGHSTGEVTTHEFRTTASSLLNESGKWHPDAIERSLAHADANAVRGTYNRGRYWNERVEMHQWWSDCLDALRASNEAQIAALIAN